MPSADPWALYAKIQQHTQAIKDKGAFVFGGDELNIEDLVISGEIDGKTIELRGRRCFSGLVHKWYDGSCWAEAQFTISGLREEELPYAAASSGLNLLREHFGEPNVFGYNGYYLKYLRRIGTRSVGRVVDKFDDGRPARVVRKAHTKPLNGMLRIQIVRTPHS